jgi:hypothetical protein
MNPELRVWVTGPYVADKLTYGVKWSIVRFLNAYLVAPVGLN